MQSANSNPIHGARSTPAATALFSSSHIAHLYPSVFSCLFEIDSLKFVVPVTNVKFTRGMSFNFSSWDVQTIHIIFFWPNDSIFNQEYFTFHLFKVVSFGIFCSMLKILHVFDQSLMKIKNCKWYIFFCTIETLSFFFLLTEGDNSWGKNKEKNIK